MKKNVVVVQKRKMNVPGLISALLFFLLFPLLLIPWYRLFILRSNTITTLLIHILGMFAIGLVMLALGITAVVINRRKKGVYKGTWTGIVGIIFGVLLAGYSGFFIVDYLIRGMP